MHIVDTGVDTGAKIAQAKVACEPSKDTESALASRVLEREHKIYPWVLNSLATSDIVVVSGMPSYTSKAISEAANLNFKIFAER